MLEFMAEHWKHLPPSYRPVKPKERSEPGDIRWLSDVRQWHQVTQAEVGKEPDEIYTFARPDEKGAPPLYRPVKPGSIRKTGMLIWAKNSALSGGEWKPISTPGRKAALTMFLIEPAPPPGWEWLETHQLLRTGDRYQQRTEGRTETRWVTEDMIGKRPTRDYFYIRSTKHTYAQAEGNTAYDQWGQF